MKTWKCKSRVINGQPCPHECIVKFDLEPRGCLDGALFQDWEEVKSEQRVLVPDERRCGYCDMTDGIHKSDCEFFRNL